MFTFKLPFSIGKHHEEKTSAPTFAEFFDRAEMILPELSQRHRPATIKNYNTALGSLRLFCAKAEAINLPITIKRLQLYEKWLRMRGTSPNTSSCYIRSLRSLFFTIYPKADKELFRHLFTGNMRTMKRALDPESVKQLIACQPPHTSSLRLWHDVFLFSVYALGMPFVDVAYLRWSDVSNGFINYRRHKTDQHISVPITPEMKQIMDYYRSRTHDNLIFPILRSYDCPYHTYQHRLSQYNFALKRLKRRAKLSQNLTSYVARHTWATLANTAGVSLSHISQAMGHTNINTTQIYLNHISDDDILNDSLTVANLIKT